ncbi:MAG: peptidylprolyl isomerase [Patescibacteria group bacterium]|jgi:cyclophilin family peptidyl-prolyl cis-trans isomerase
MKKLIGFLPILLISSLFFSACSVGTNTDNNMNLNDNIQNNNQNFSSDSSPTATQPLPETDDSIVAINTSYGQIVVKLYPDQAPNTVKNFINKAKNGFYKGLTFHRVEPGFVVQGGDPLGNGTGGGQINSEINSIPFVKGSLGLARGGNKQISNDSQFFICLTTESCQHLTGEYVNFGEVVSGFQYVEDIKVGDKILEITTQTK